MPYTFVPISLPASPRASCFLLPASLARSAAARLRKQNVPTLSRPPSDRKQSSGGASASGNGGGGEGDTLDLLSGFELEGASNSNANKSVVGAPPGGGGGGGIAGADIFAGFAAPADAAATNTGAAAPTSVPGAVAGGDWVVVGGVGGAEDGRAVGGVGVQVQGLSPATADAGGVYGGEIKGTVGGGNTGQGCVDGVEVPGWTGWGGWV